MIKRFPIGTWDFRVMREKHLYYVDKTRLVRGILDDEGTDVFLFPRPRRFGKTLNLTMLRYFLEKGGEDLSHLFEGLEVWNAGEPYRRHFQRYPVLYLTFKDLKPASLEEWWEGIRDLVQELFLEHTDLLENSRLPEADKKRFLSLMNGEASRTHQQKSLRLLTSWLNRHYGEKVVVLIDEYDTPIHAAYVGKFAEPVLSFFRSFLGGGLKDNPALFKGVVTGILRVAKENIFSGINNLEVRTLLDHDYADCYGFTEFELESLLETTGLTEWKEVIDAWYNGYRFGEHVIYNPWSVLNFLKDPRHIPIPYWLNTSANDLVRHALELHAHAVREDVQTLIDGGAVDKYVDDNIILSKLDYDMGTVWSMLLFSGYLKAAPLPVEPLEVVPYRLSIPNREVRQIYLDTFRGWLGERLAKGGGQLDEMLRALLSGDTSRLEMHLEGFVAGMLSYHDRYKRDPEAIYHGLVLGLCASLEPGHRVVSNRESGEGRPDVLVLPAQQGGPGVAMELKVAVPRKKSMTRALKEAREQILSKGYVSELEAAGAGPIWCYAVAFDGKRVKVEGVPGDANSASGKSPG